MHARSRLLALAALAALLCWSIALGAEPPAVEGAPADATTTEGEEKKEEKWDVTRPFGPAHDVTVDTREGTWMCLDVSPDGRTIAFDLLGDIWSMPIAGGEATALTSGPAWDMQPRFSPDGTRLAFTSDRGAGDNLWTMAADGTDAQQVTKETFRLVTSPAWDPSGMFLAGRKHFTSKRSLGAGEIWLWHTSGGDGAQMTARANEQKDLGEPAFSPDGKHVYYSYDATPGRFFEYNKDPNPGIYAIDRLDRQTGEILTILSGPGGACRPTPSPDGKTLAFVRRVRFQSTLFLLDLTSGAETPVYDGLERDMQETWAVHGVYPTMAWTPDSGSIVFWAKGGIHRFDLPSGKATPIPFHAKQTHVVHDAVRFPVEVAPDEFDVKMLRWVEVSPAGDRVVFQALGYIYARDLPDGAARRLTQQNERWEMFPAFSRDGRSIVYTTWDDDDLGDIRIAPATGGEGRVITGKPGHYIEPALSPDGEWVVYRRVGGGYMTSPLWSQEPGVYRVPAAGGEETLVTRNGVEPHFGAASERVFLLRVSGDETSDQRRLVSVGLDGEKEMTHLNSGGAVRYRVSPDGRWVAFQEKFNAFVAPFAPTGRELSIGPKSSALPVALASKDAGDFLHWSGDSAALRWSTGPELFTRRLDESFKWIDGAPEELPEVSGEGLNISFRAKADRPDGAIALINARIITMKGDEVIERGTVLVEGARITRVAPGAVPYPRTFRTIDCAGKTIMPGIVDVHAHGAQGTNDIIPQTNWLHDASLAFGTTTIHDPSNDTQTFFAASEMGRAGLLVMPRSFSTGTILYGAAGSFRAEIESLDDARSHLRRMQDVGAFSVKSYNQPRRDQRQQVLQAARELNMMVVPEGGSTLAHNLTMVMDGHTGLEHNIPVENAYADIVQLWSGTEMGYTPTLVVCYGGLNGENYWYDKTDVWADERLTRFVPRFIVDPRSRRRGSAPAEEYNHLSAARLCKEFTDAGISVHVGAHGQLAGLAAHWEMWMFHQGGMTPLECIGAGTINGARHLGLERDIGSIEEGKLADLLILGANPLEEIHNTAAIDFTMINGRLYNARTMDQAGNHPDDRGTRRYGDGSMAMGSRRWWLQGGASAGPAEAKCACDAGAHTHN